MAMADSPYLVCLALALKDGQRAMPLAGKSSRRADADQPSDPGEEGRGLALELLLRLWQGSDAATLQRAAGDDSLLLVELPLEEMSEQLPLLKARWLASGDTASFAAELRPLVQRAWRISVAKYEPITFTPWV